MTRRITHHKCDTPEYGVWQGMFTRCYNKNFKDYKHWGGRGVTVCDRWRDFELFLQDVGERPTPDHQIDRINNNGNYEPDNVKWSTRKEQKRNTRSNRFITYNGETLTLAEWCERLSVPHSRVWIRLKHGWSVEDALTGQLHKVTKKRNDPQWQSLKTECKRGHPLTGTNVYIHKQRGTRHCKACQFDRDRVYEGRQPLTQEFTLASNFNTTAPIIRQHTVEGYEVKMTINSDGISFIRKGDKSRDKKSVFVSWSTICELGAEKAGTGQSFYEILGFD